MVDFPECLIETCKIGESVIHGDLDDRFVRVDQFAHCMFHPYIVDQFQKTQSEIPLDIFREIRV